jgi:hypothetical protein
LIASSLVEAQESLRIEVRDADLGTPISGAIVVARTSRGAVHTCDPSPIACIVQNLQTGEKVDIQIAPSNDGRFSARELAVVAGSCRTNPCEMPLFLLSRAHQRRLNADLVAAREYRSLGQQDRTLVTLGPHRTATQSLSSESAVCAQYLLAAAEEMLCLDTGYSTCASSEETLADLLTARREDAGLFEACRVSEALLKRDLEQLRQRREIQERYRKIVDLLQTRSRTCEAAESLAAVAELYEQDPGTWMRHGISLGRLLRDEVLARRLCYQAEKRANVDVAALRVHLDKWEAKLGEAVGLLGGGVEFSESLSFIALERSSLGR